MSSIKDKKNDDKLLKHSQNAKIVLRQKSNVILEKII